MEQKIRRDRNMGSNLRRLRDQYGISQEKLCAELQRRGCDIGRTAYAKYESGELNIRASVLIELRKIYSCSYCITSFYSPSFLYRHKKTTPPVLEGPHSTWIYP